MNRDKLEEAVRDILVGVGEDPGRPGLRDTPARVSRMYDELLAGYALDPITLINDALFDVDYDEMVIVRDIEFYSLCEHHIIPFLGHAHIAYVPRGKIIGLSKIPRVVDAFARRLQVQERMTRQIADCLTEVLRPQGVGVVLEAIHLCSMMRGIRKSDARMVTSAMCGVFKQDPRTRAEFMDHIRRPIQNEF